MTDSTTPPAWEKSYPAYVSWNAALPCCPVADLLEHTVQNYGRSPGFDFLGRRLSWGQIGAQVAHMAHGLQDIGVVKGTKVGIFMPNSHLYLIAYYAILKIGGTVVNCNPLYSAKEIAHQIEDSQADVIVTVDLKICADKIIEIMPESRLKKIVLARFSDLLPFPKSFLFGLAKRKDVASIPPSDKIIWLPDIMSNAGTPRPVAITPESDIAVLQYTGGTTGVPKAAMLTHQNVVANVMQAYLYLNMTEKGHYRMLGVLPFFHVFAMTAVMNLSVVGAFEIIGLPRFDLDQTLKTIDRKKPDFFPAVPAIYNAINHTRNLAKYNLRSIKFCISGGAPLPVEVKRAFEENTGCVVAEGYGLTEASPVLCCNPPDRSKNRPGTIGFPLPGTLVEIIDPQDRKTRMKPGERGELCARGPQIMKGYWNRPEDTAAVLDNGTLHTGDVAIMDEDGYFTIVDRIKDMIITNGYKVYPRNVEEALYLNPVVEECIVAGIPDTSRGEIVKAWIKPKDGWTVTEAEIRTWLDGRISKTEMPRSIEIRTRPLPKTMIGKLSRKDVLAEESAKNSAA